MAITSEADICNLALDAFGDRAIVSIEMPETAGAVIMARHYDIVRQNVLQDYLWNFSKAEKTLPRTITDSVFYNAAFPLPLDYIRLIRVGGPGRELRSYDFRGRSLVMNTDANSLPIIYIRDEDEVSLFTPHFIQILALRLALATAYQFSLKNSVVQGIRARLQEEEPKAVSVNSQDRTPDTIIESDLLGARNLYGNRDNRFY